MSDSLRLHESQDARPPCPSLTPEAHSDSRPSSQRCHPAISSSVVPFSSHLRSFLASVQFSSVARLCLTLCNPMDCNRPRFPVHHQLPEPSEIHVHQGFPRDSDGKESACNARDLGLIPGLGRSPGGGHGNPLQYSCLENPHRQRSLVGYSPWDCKELGSAE